MTIVYKDGGLLSCSTVEVSCRELFCDDVYIVPIEDVDHIEND